MNSTTQSDKKVATAKSYIEQLYNGFRTHIEEYQTTIKKGTIYLLAVNSTLFLCDNQQLQVELSLSELIFVST